MSLKSLKRLKAKRYTALKQKVKNVRKKKVKKRVVEPPEKLVAFVKDMLKFNPTVYQRSFLEDARAEIDRQ